MVSIVMDTSVNTWSMVVGRYESSVLSTHSLATDIERFEMFVAAQWIATLLPLFAVVTQDKIGEVVRIVEQEGCLKGASSQHEDVRLGAGGLLVGGHFHVLQRMERA